MDYLSSVMSEQAHGDPFDLADPPPRRKLEKNSHNTQDEEAGKVSEAVMSVPGPKILRRATVADASVEQEREMVRSEARAPANRSRRARADRRHPDIADRDRGARPSSGLQSSADCAVRSFGGGRRPSAIRNRADATHALARRTNTCRTGQPAVTT